MGRTKRQKPPRKPGEPLANPVAERYAGQRAMGLSQSAALRQADPRCGRRKPQSVEQMASRMEADPDVKERTKEIVGDLLLCREDWETPDGVRWTFQWLFRIGTDVTASGTIGACEVVG